VRRCRCRDGIPLRARPGRIGAIHVPGTLDGPDLADVVLSDVFAVEPPGEHTLDDGHYVVRKLSLTVLERFVP
jgi:hypothetical protein